MAIRFISSLALLSLSLPAFAAADLTTSITPPGATDVYAAGRYNVTVSNIGNRDASSVVVTIQLPETNTSPQVYVMGTVGAKSASCAASGTKLVCSVGTVRKYKSTTVYFDLSLPESSDALVIGSTASTTSAENSTSNNSDSETASLLYFDVSPSGDQAVNNSHCTGTGLAAYYECTLFPSSLSAHSTVLNADHTITIPDAPDYTGTWSQPTSDALHFSYYDELGALVATFEGRGVDSSCWEGLTTFPGSSYVAPYEVCFE